MRQILTVLRLMLTEEYRLHVSYSSSRVFFSMPLYVFMIAFFLTATLPIMEDTIPVADLLLFTNAGVFVYGLSVGAFGFLGKTYLERRYGRANFLVAMPFLLPITFRRAYASMYLRDVIFYIVLILVPGLGGVLLASTFAHFHLSSVLVSFVTVTLSFLLGISFSFLASVLYLRSRALFVSMVLAYLGLAVAYGVFALIPLEYVLPSWGFQVNLSPLGDDLPQAALYLVASIVISLAMAILAVVSVAEAPLGKVAHIKENFPRYYETMRFARSLQSLLAKEFSDMGRSGGLSKMLLAYVAPLLILSFTTWYVNNGLAIPVGFNTVFYAAMVGSFGIMLYSWIANIDAVDYLETLPVSVPQVIKAKLVAFFLITMVIATGFVVVIALANDETQLLWLALPVLYITSAFMVIATAYLTGLSPNSVLFNPSVMTRFMAISILPDLGITILSFSLASDPLFAAAGIALVCFALLACTLFFYRGLDRKYNMAGFL